MIVRAKTIFTGERFVDDCHLVIAGDNIVALSPNRDLKTGEPIVDFKRGTIIPGLIDIHVNGGGGILFNDRQDKEGLQTILQTHACTGTTGMVPTFMTDTLEATERALFQTAKIIRNQEVVGILGIHLEGPFMNPIQKGTHNPKLMLKPSRGNLKRIINASTDFPGKKIITLAPELFSPSQLQSLREAGFIIMAGHTDADFDSLKKYAEMIDGFTHFYNGMGKVSARYPQSIGYVLSSKKKFWLSLIVDGIHVHPAMLDILFSLHPSKRLLLITDAMPSLGGKKTFYHQGKKISLKRNLLVDEYGTISGAQLSMIQAVSNLNRNKYDFFTSAEVLRMASLYPAQFLGLTRSGQRHGKLKSGYQADLTVINHDLREDGLGKRNPNPEDLQVKGTMIAGNWVYRSSH